MANYERSLSRMTEIRERFWRLSNMVVKADAQRNSFQFTVPGFKFDDFDKAGRPSHHKIVKLFEMVRFLRGVDFDNSSRDNTIGAVMMGYNIEIKRELYKRAAINYPMNIEHCLSHVGKSSLSIAQRITDATTGNLLVKRSMTVVNVDLSSSNLKPLPFDDTFRDKFNSKVDKSSPPEMLHPITSIPEHRFTCEIVVRADETDLFEHTTTASYTVYLVECALQATAAKFFSVVDEFSLLHRSKLRFVRESFVGDKLTLAAWEDANNPLIIRVVITRVKDNRDSCYAEIEYYPSAMTSHL